MYSVLLTLPLNDIFIYLSYSSCNFHLIIVKCLAIYKKKNNFFRSSYDELKLVVWPNKQQLFSESVAVIIMVSFSAAAIASVSRFYGWAASQIFG